MLSFYLSLYTLAISILVEAKASKDFGRSQSQTPLANMRTYNLGCGCPLKVVLTLINVFLKKSSSHMVYKVLYIKSFYSLYYCRHYDHCLVNIVILYFMQTWSLYIIKIIYCIFPGLSV